MGDLARPFSSGHTALAVGEAKQVAREKDGVRPVLFAFTLEFLAFLHLYFSTK